MARPPKYQGVIHTRASSEVERCFPKRADTFQKEPILSKKADTFQKEPIPSKKSLYFPKRAYTFKKEPILSKKSLNPILSKKSLYRPKRADTFQKELILSKKSRYFSKELKSLEKVKIKSSEHRDKRLRQWQLAVNDCCLSCQQSIRILYPAHQSVVVGHV